MKTFSATVRSGKSVGSWKMIAMPAACDCAVVSNTTSSPSISTRPLSGRCTPARILTSVDLPAPFSPTSAWASPRRSSIQPSASACTAPKLLLAWSTTSSGASARRLPALARRRQARWKISSSSARPSSGRRSPSPSKNGAISRCQRAFTSVSSIARARRVEVVALAHADHQAGRRDEERVVAPPGRGQRGAHLGPDRGVPLAVLRDAVRPHLELEADSLGHGREAVWAAARRPTRELLRT